jgi:hypothetical protein
MEAFERQFGIEPEVALCELDYRIVIGGVETADERGLLSVILQK